MFVPQFSFHVFDHQLARGFQNRFSTQYRCYSVSMLAGPNDRSDVEKGGKSESHSKNGHVGSDSHPVQGFWTKDIEVQYFLPYQSFKSKYV